MYKWVATYLYRTKHYFIEPGDAPANFNSDVVNSTAIRLTWDKPRLSYGIILSYTITYNTSLGNVSRVENSTEARDIVITNLQEHTWYGFEIVASTRIGDGPYAYVIRRTDISGMYIHGSGSDACFK